MKYRAVVVEDEEIALSRLKRILAGFPQSLEIIGEAKDGPSAIDIINSLAPDLVFLDINLPGCDGFNVLQKLTRQPIVIFTTSHDQHALEAFKTNAVDYLLKPVGPEAVRKTLEKLDALGFSQDWFSKAIGRIAASMEDRFLTHVPCKVGEKTVLVKTGEILYFQSSNKYTEVKTASRAFLLDNSLADLEQKLNPKDFLRIHRGTLVNVSWIAEIKSWYEGRKKVVLKDAASTELEVSRGYAENLKGLLEV